MDSTFSQQYAIIFCMIQTLQTLDVIHHRVNAFKLSSAIQNRNADIVFVGSNPSCASKNDEPFDIRTKSGITLRSWAYQANITKYDTYNISPHKTEKNRPLSTAEIVERIPYLIEDLHRYDSIIAVGETASKALKMAEISHLKLPHPSGLNRKLNDPIYVQECIDELKEYYAR